MIKETNVTSDYIKAISGKFDLEAVFLLDLREKSISKLKDILKCKNLVFLNLSNNKITNIAGIEGFKELSYLDLSYNQISNIDGIDFLIKLKHLKLQGNKIEKPKSFAKFSALINLEKLFFQEVSQNESCSNPICKITNYRTEIFKIFINLKSLDGIRKHLEVLFQDTDSIVENDNKIDPKDFNFNFKESKKFKIKILRNKSNEWKSRNKFRIRKF